MTPPKVTSPVRHIAIIGGGVSGLAAAHRLGELAAGAQRPLQVTVFEAQSALGGLVGTKEVDGYRIETGADSFITNKPGAIRLCERLGLAGELIPTDARFRRSLVLSRGRAVAVPEGFQLLAPNSLWPVWKSPIFSLGGKLRLAAEPFVPRPAQPVVDESLASFVRRRLGQEALDRLVQPLVGGIYTSDPERLSLRATMPRFLDMEASHGSLIRALQAESGESRGPQDRTASGARYGLFATPRLGISQMVETLVARVGQTAQIQTSCPIESIDSAVEGDGFVLRLAGREAVRCDGVIVATPAHRAAQLLKGLRPAASQALGEIEYASTVIVVSGHRLADVAHPLDAFGLVIPAIEKRRILAVSFTSRKFPNRAPEGSVQLRTFVGGAMQPELVRQSDEAIVELVREELTELLGVTWRPEVVVVARWMNSMPQYHVGHLDIVQRIENDLATTPRLALGGNALHGVGLPDTITSGETAAERVWQNLEES
ncbi:MAG TPA: protoporphyrinogen oxidase [Planctomycetaceae bacterium]|nr:protoporphyrinogen oxidase [Planctomycetaceae bacterium]